MPSKKYVVQEDINEIKEPENLCKLHDKTNWKLELDYELHIGESHNDEIFVDNEIIYYIDDSLGRSSFGGINVG